MIYILSMVILGVIGGAITCLWTRLIRKNMIFGKLGKFMERANNRHIAMFKEDSVLIKFFRCGFCLSVWLILALEVFYVIHYSPAWYFALIGTFGGLGAGNFVVETVYTMRNEGV